MGPILPALGSSTNAADIKLEFSFSEYTAIKDSCYKSSLFDDNDNDRNIIYKSIILLTNSQINLKFT